jgi:hypothetical protein
VPTQKDPQAVIAWEAIRLTGQDALAVRASKKLRNDELLIPSFAASRLRMEMDRVPLWRGEHVAIRQLIEDFGKYPYLPRLQGPEVLTEAVRSGVALLTWEQDAFAYADGYDEAGKRYRGLRGGRQVPIPPTDSPGLLVKPDVARSQLAAEAPAGQPADSAGGDTAAAPSPGGRGAPAPSPATASSKPKRFHGTASLDPTRVGRDAGRIAEEVVTHLSGLVGAQVTVTLEIQADIPGGAPDNVVRTVTENARTLKFSSQGFEKE